MDCEITSESLVTFYFDSSQEPKSLAIEEHLLKCRGCLREFLTLKRDIERGRDSKLRPSRAVRERILGEASKLLNADTRRVQRIKPIKKYAAWGAAAAAVLIFFLLTLGDHTRLGWHGEPLFPDKSQNEAITRGTSQSSDIFLKGIIDSGGTRPGHINIL